MKRLNLTTMIVALSLGAATLATTSSAADTRIIRHIDRGRSGFTRVPHVAHRVVYENGHYLGRRVDHLGIGLIGGVGRVTRSRTIVTTPGVVYTPRSIHRLPVGDVRIVTPAVYYDINGRWAYDWGVVRITEVGGSFSATITRTDGRSSRLIGRREGNTIQGTFYGDTGTGRFSLVVNSPSTISGSAMNHTMSRTGSFGFYR